MDLLRKGMQGPLVNSIQQQLVEAGYSIAQDELTQATFGDSTYSAVRSFQASHLGPQGRPLAEDGVVGPETLYALQHPGHTESCIAPGWRCEPSQVRAAVRPVVEAAVGEIGVRESPDGSNDGPEIRRYTAPDYIGSPWCCCFLSWCFARCDGGSPFGRIASVGGLYDWANQNNRLLSAAAIPQAGDVALILRSYRHGHGMLIVGPTDRQGNFCTVAGNESNAVRGGIRNRNHVSAILRPIPLV